MNIIDKIIDCVEENMTTDTWQGEPIPILTGKDKKRAYSGIEKILQEYEYKKAYDILMAYWGCIPDADKIKIHDKLLGLGL